MADAADPVLIGVDWGTTHLRAALLSADGGVHDVRERGLGISRVGGGAPGFAHAFHAVCGDWRARRPDLPALICGMAGSRQGWIEAPYAQAPAGFAELVAALAVAPGAERVWIVPGVQGRSPFGGPEVMRGEETQAAGSGVADGWLVHPGTHAKWIRMERGRIADFATFMTGELFDIVARHSILARTMAEGPVDDMAFDRGADTASAGGGVTHQLFGVRTRALLEGLGAAAQRSWLSGVLIGAEVAAMRDLAQGPVGVIGAAHLTKLYIRAMRRAGLDASIVDGDGAAWRGLLRIAVAAGLVRKGV